MCTRRKLGPETFSPCIRAPYPFISSGITDVVFHVHPCPPRVTPRLVCSFAYDRRRDIYLFDVVHRDVDTQCRGRPDTALPMIFHLGQRDKSAIFFVISRPILDVVSPRQSRAQKPDVIVSCKSLRPGIVLKCVCIWVMPFFFGKKKYSFF